MDICVYISVCVCVYLATRSRDEILVMAEKYKGEFQQSMTEDIRKDTSGNYWKAIETVLNRKPDSEFVIPEAKVKQDVDALYAAGFFFFLSFVCFFSP